MKQLIVGILAHVDAGKTTLSEAMLFQSGRLKKLGRVDHQDAFLDTFSLERSRGITIFSKQAVLPLEHISLTLLDTPGHVDFSAEMERTLQVLDYAVLVISGSDGVQAHTRTLWQLLERYHVPVFLFINKMDLAGADKTKLLAQLRSTLGDGFVDFSLPSGSDDFMESVAMCDEGVLNHYLETETVEQSQISALIARRKLFPCYFGSALKLDGVDELLSGLEQYAAPPRYPQAFGAKVYKITRDTQGARLTHLKVTGGALRVKDLLTNRHGGTEQEHIWEEKADQLRIYSGVKFEAVEQVDAGGICAVTGLSATFPGQGLGCEVVSEPPMLEPVLTYRMILPPDCQPHTALVQLRQLEEEDPQLHITWSEQLKEIHVQLMGAIQLEILKELIAQRFDLDVDFDAGSILYRETIAAPVEGVGHFEPLRHYAEVHLLLEPGERGRGLRFFTSCNSDEFDSNWQRLILAHLEERTHLGALTGSPITDMDITLVAGRGHIKHTEGGDFREATYRAVRQGLMSANSILLEPWYNFRLEVPGTQVGRAMSDLQRMSSIVDPPELIGDEAVLIGSAPVSQLRDYAMDVATYTRGLGRLFSTLKGYEPCHNQAQVVAELGYDPNRDTEHTGDSVFCAHGAGFLVKWDQVREHMHVDSGLRFDTKQTEEKSTPAARNVTYSGSAAEDKELLAIYERTYGTVQPHQFTPSRPKAERTFHRVDITPPRPEYLLVDGYNIMFAWDELNAIAQDNLDAARQILMDTLSNYQGFKNNHVILVFDAYKVPRGVESVVRYHNIHVVYTKEAETADSYIEKTSYQLSKSNRVRVATSDGAQQLIIMGHGSLRISAREFLAELEQVSGQISQVLRQNNRSSKSNTVGEALRRAEKPKE